MPEHHSAAPTDNASRHNHEDDHEHGGVGQYLAVFAALCVLTCMSFFTYTSYWPFDKDATGGRHITWAFMMAVSVTKAMLVIMFFMHLLWEANWKWVLTIPASFMSIFLMLMLVPDVGWRQDNGYAHYSYERLQYAADPRAVTQKLAEAAEKELPHDESIKGTH